MAQASGLTITQTIEGEALISWTPGSGGKSIVWVRNTAQAGQADVVNNTTYAADADVGSGDLDLSGFYYCVYNGVGSSVYVTHFGSAGSAGRVFVYDYSGGAGSETYDESASAANQVDFTALASEPTVQASGITFSNVTATTMDVTVDAIGDGGYCTIFAKAASSGTPAPVDGTYYTENNTFGSGNQIGSSGWYAVGYLESPGTATVDGLSAGTTYRYMALAANGGPSVANWLLDTATGNPANQATTGGLDPATEPTAQASGLLFSNILTDRMTVALESAGNGNFVAIFAKQASVAAVAVPVDGTAYTGNTTFAGGTQIGSSGYYCVYSGAYNGAVTVTGLDTGLPYTWQAFTYNGDNITFSPNYLQDTATHNPLTMATLSAARTFGLYTGQQAPTFQITATGSNSITTSQAPESTYSRANDNAAPGSYVSFVDSSFERKATLFKFSTAGLPTGLVPISGSFIFNITQIDASNSSSRIYGGYSGGDLFAMSNTDLNAAAFEQLVAIHGGGPTPSSTFLPVVGTVTLAFDDYDLLDIATAIQAATNGAIYFGVVPTSDRIPTTLRIADDGYLNLTYNAPGLASRSTRTSRVISVDRAVSFSRLRPSGSMRGA